MAVNISFDPSNPADRAYVADILERLGTDRASQPSGDDWPSTPAEPVEETAPWDEPASESRSKASADPWADDATPSTPKAATASTEPPGRGTLFPNTGEYDKDTPNGNRHWNFGVMDAPNCDCGYRAAKVTGRKAGAKRDWNAYWCPVKFGKNFRDACKFSEFA